MRQLTIWCVVLLLPVLVLGGMWVARRDLTQPNLVLPTQMAVSAAYKSQTANPVLPDYMTLQPPAEGTLPRGAQSFDYRNTDADRLLAGRELRNPYRAGPEEIARGKRVFETFCLVCHGTEGRGDGPLIPTFPNPPSFSTESSRKLSDGEMFHTISLGGKKMGSHAAQVPWEERWLVILYVRSLQEGEQ